VRRRRWCWTAAAARRRAQARSRRVGKIGQALLRFDFHEMRTQSRPSPAVSALSDAGLAAQPGFAARCSAKSGRQSAGSTGWSQLLDIARVESGHVTQLDWCDVAT